MSSRFSRLSRMSVVCAVAAWCDGAASAQSTPATTVTAPFVLILPSPCTAEAVKITGTTHLTQRHHVDEDGDLYFIDMIHTEGLKGVGVLTGDSYVFGHAEEFIFISKTPQTEFTHELYERVYRIRNGAEFGDDFYIRLKQHLTINANGVPTAEFNEGEVDCR
jgi:hypothetical protein